jgi:ABC-type microcin C transport system permease subunit YejE
MFYILVSRSFLASFFTAAYPLYQSYSDDIFFPIPPNRECIETVDFVLHIPVAVDYFYNYLQSRHE